MNIAYGANINIPSVQYPHAPDDAAVAILGAKLELGGYPAASQFLDLAWSAYSHKENIAKFMSAVAQAEHCAVVNADNDWLPSIITAGYAANASSAGIFGMMNAGLPAPNPDISYTAAYGGTSRRDYLDVGGECAVLADLGEGIDTFDGSPCDDIVLGGEGDDIIDGAGGSDYLFGGAGNDHYQIDSLAGDIVSDWGEGNDHDIVHLGDVTMSEVSFATLQGNPGDLIVRFRNTGVNSLLAGALNTGEFNAIEEITFSDGSSIATSELIGAIEVLDDTVPQNTPPEDALVFWDMVSSVNPSTVPTSTEHFLEVRFDNRDDFHVIDLPVALEGRIQILDGSFDTNNIVYAIDVSHSTDVAGNDCNGDLVVDENDDFAPYDAGVGTILDCEVGAILALNESLGSDGNISVGVVSFARDGNVELGLVSPPDKDSDGDGITDVEQAVVRLRQLSGTHFPNALSAVGQLLNSAPSSFKQHVYFLSDGDDFRFDGIEAQAADLQARNISVDTYAIGNESRGCQGTALGAVAEFTEGQCYSVEDVSTLQNGVFFHGIPPRPPAGIDRLAVSVNGGGEVDASIDGAGNWAVTVPSTELLSNSNSLEAIGYASDGTVAIASIALNYPDDEDIEDNCPGVDNPEQTNSDEDAMGDACDDDDDNDGLSDDEEAALGTNPLVVDTDGDDSGDATDNCPVDPNADQADLDGDLVGDVCDDDMDGDGVDNVDDAFPRNSDESADEDADSVGDNGDNCPMDANVSQADFDGNGLGDACDQDEDGDGVANSADLCPATLIPENTPLVNLRRNRFALTGNGAAPATFESTSRRVFTTEDTGGCSCEQILEQPGFGGARQAEYGCVAATLIRWSRQVP
ncbi:thrombospondin type 3 repeat-containing protein [Granulosicoccus sp. 3-233]